METQPEPLGCRPGRCTRRSGCLDRPARPGLGRVHATRGMRSMSDIRAITAADHAAWLKLWQGYQRFYDSQIPEATSAITWQRFLDPSEPMHAALAWRDGE